MRKVALQRSSVSSSTSTPLAEQLSTGGAQTRPRRTTHTPGEVGTWVFILGDMAVFALLFGVFIYYRGKEPVLYAASQLEVHRGFGAINTLLLLTGSLFVVAAVRAIRSQIHRMAQVAIGVALLCGAE